VTNISKSFYLQDGGKKSTGIDMERLLRHCHPMYNGARLAKPLRRRRMVFIMLQTNTFSVAACMPGKKITKYKYAVSNVDPYKIRTHKSIYILPIRN